MASKIPVTKNKKLTEKGKRDAKKRYIMICIAAAELEMDESGKGQEQRIWNPLTGCDNMEKLEGNIALLEGMLYFHQNPENQSSTAILMDNRANQRIFNHLAGGSGTSAVLEILDITYSAMKNLENMDEATIQSIRLGLLTLGRVCSVECDNSEGEMDNFAVISLREETKNLLNHFYFSVTDDLFRFNANTDATFHFPLTLAALLQFSDFLHLRIAFLRAVAEKSVSFERLEAPDISSATAVIDVARYSVKRLYSELFPVIRKAKRQNQDSEILSKEDPLEFTIPPRNFDSLPEIVMPWNVGPALIKSYTLMKRAHKRKLQQQLEQIRQSLRLSTVGKSITEPDFCTAIFKMEIVLDSILSDMHS